MNALIKILHTALEITGIAFNPVQGGVILEFDMKHLCYFGMNSLENALSSTVPLHPVTNGKTKNVLLPDTREYLHWDYNAALALITATETVVKDKEENKKQPPGTKRPKKLGPITNTAHFFRLDGTNDGQLHLPGLYEIGMVFPGQEKNIFLCVHSKPVNLDFYETGIGIYSKTDTSYTVSEKVRTQELAIGAWWNASVNGWVIHDEDHNGLYLWDNDSKDVTIVTPPESCKPDNVLYTVSKTANFVVAAHKNAKGMIDTIWNGEVLPAGIQWSKPAGILAGDYMGFAVHHNGTKVAALRNAANRNLLHVFDATTGDEMYGATIPDSCTGVGFGWVSEHALACAGTECIALIDLKSNTVARPANNKLKLPKSRAIE